MAILCREDSVKVDVTTDNPKKVAAGIKQRLNGWQDSGLGGRCCVEMEEYIPGLIDSELNSIDINAIYRIARHFKRDDRQYGLTKAFFDDGTTAIFKRDYDEFKALLAMRNDKTPDRKIEFKLGDKAAFLRQPEGSIQGVDPEQDMNQRTDVTDFQAKVNNCVNDIVRGLQLMAEGLNHCKKK